MQNATHLNILGTRGIPAAHGGFETFAQRLALFLVRQGFGVTVYCQTDGPADLDGREDYWKGVHRVHFGTRRNGAAGTMEFDLACARHVRKQPGVDLVLGYNTAIFNLLQKIKRRRVFMNMDGIEWQRKKWSLPAKLWLIMNEIIGANLANVPICDHPDIGRHISRRTLRKVRVIPYGSDTVERANTRPVKRMGLRPGGYFLSVARIEPENSIAELIEAFLETNTRMDMVVLGNMNPDNSYHRMVRDLGRGRVMFPGGIYDDAALKSLRFHARAYLHGHQVGGTNPSLVEALGAGNAVLAHDNRFNRWTAGQGQYFFKTLQDCTAQMDRLAVDDIALQAARKAARERHLSEFQWDNVLGQYRDLMLSDTSKLQIAAE